MGSTVVVRPAEPTEADALCELALAAKALWGYSAAQLDAWRGELRIAAESIVKEPTFVAEANGLVLGFAQLETAQHPWALRHLWVHPAQCRRGVGRLLVQHALRHARDRGQSALSIDADPHAQAFYLRLGAQWVGEVAAPIQGQADRVRPQLVLSAQ